MGGDRSPESLELANRMVGRSGRRIRDVVPVLRLLQEHGCCREIHNLWNNRKGIKGRNNKTGGVCIT